jgi:hypothetical protein
MKPAHTRTAVDATYAIAMPAALTGPPAVSLDDDRFALEPPAVSQAADRQW